MWCVMGTVDVPLLLQDLFVMRQSFIPVFVKIDNMDGPPNGLGKPDRGTVANSQVPPGIYQGSGIIRHISHAPLFLGFLQLFPVNRTWHIGNPGTLKLLLKLIWRHHRFSST